MKLLETEIPDCVLEVFYKWCELVDYDKIESNFILFLEDAVIHFNTKKQNNEDKIIFPLMILKEDEDKEIEILVPAYNNYKWCIFCEQDTELQWVLLSEFNKYLDEIKERHGASIL